jgi:hypothetical protein
MWRETIIAVLLSQSTIELIKFLIERHDKKKSKELTPEQKGIRALLQKDLGVNLRDWKHSEERLAADWEIIQNEYESYRELHGNGEIQKLYEECEKIPTTE